MSFGATITVTVNAVAKILNRINQDSYGSEYLLRETLQEFRILIRHSKVKANASTGAVARDRHNLELTQTVFSTVTDKEIIRKTYSVFEVPYNDSLTSAGYLSAALVDYLDSSTVQADLFTWQN